MLAKDTYLTALGDNAQALADASVDNLAGTVPSCPDWTVGTLLGHLGAAYAMVSRQIEAGTAEDVVQSLEDIRLPAGVAAWVDSQLAPDAMPTGVVPWFRATADELVGLMTGVDPGAPAWTWYPPDQTTGFWMRRMAHETLIHRWDAELARGATAAFDPPLAADGIDEALFIYQQTVCRPQSKLEGDGESYRFRCTDTSGDWLVRFDGPLMTVSREPGTADVVVRGSASDLFLFLWHRIPADRLEIEGAPAVLARYFELAPPD